MVNNTYVTLGARAPVPCSIGDAHGVAMSFLEPGLTITPLPFRHPELLDKEVRIHVTHTGCCHSDVMRATLSWYPGVNFPLVPGHEIVGIVTKVGEKVTRFKEGDKVGFGVWRTCCEEYDSCRECRLGYDNFCPKRAPTYEPHFGGYSTSFQGPSSHFYHLDESFPGEAAPLFCAGLTMYSPLRKHLRQGMKVGIVGVGGLGHVGLKLARAMGAEVTAISTNANKEAKAREFGAHHFLHLKDENQVKIAQNSLDLIVNTSISINIEENCGLLRPRGILNIVGKPPASDDLHFNLIPILMKNITLTGNPVGSRLECEEMLDFCTLNNIYPQSEVFRFADAQLAIDSLANGIPHFPTYRNVLETASFMKTFTPNLQ